MKRTLKMKLVILSTVGCQAFAQNGSPLSIHLYDLAGVPPRTLDAAIVEAASILRAAGVQTTWQRGSSDVPESRDLDFTARHTEPDARNFLVVRIESGATVYPGALGYSLPSAHSGVHAMIFWDRIEKQIQPSIITMPKMLGCAMAHEIGHVLLASSEHSATGIMKARWAKADLQIANASLLRFTAGQCTALREHASMRVAASLRVSY